MIITTRALRERRPPPRQLSPPMLCLLHKIIPGPLALILYFFTLCSLSHFRHLMKISSKSIHNFLSYLPLKNTWIQKIQTMIWITPKSLSTSFLSHFGHVLKILSASVHNFSNYLPLKNSVIQKIQTVIRITPKI